MLYKIFILWSDLLGFYEIDQHKVAENFDVVEKLYMAFK